MTIKLSRLEKVNLRHVWQSEATDFTPWLAQEENISVLSDALGFGEDGLEVEAQEKNVGPFRADILCKDTASGDWVLIENQLEKTDHVHLGQLLTYASGLHAATIVWVAQKFTDEHRSTLDWLNEITDQKFNFFGLEVELWKIGDSQIAPKFNVVCKPNDWSRSVSGAAKALNPNLSDLNLLYQEYWAALNDRMEAKGSHIRRGKPLAQSWMNYAIGRSNFTIMGALNSQRKFIYVALVLGGENSKAYFQSLLQKRDYYDQAFGETLDWRELPDKVESRIVVQRDADPTDKNAWYSQQEWMIERIEKFHKVFSSDIKAL